MKHVLVTLPLDESYRTRLAAIAGDGYSLQFINPKEDRDPYIKALEQANVILGEPNTEDLQFCRHLEWMQITWSGVDYYVQSSTFPEGAVLSCATGLYGPIIAEHMLALTLALSRRLPEYAVKQQQKKWELLLHDKPLEKSNVLILGAGDIGTTLAQWMRPMVGRIVGIRRTVWECPPALTGWSPWTRWTNTFPGRIMCCAVCRERCRQIICWTKPGFAA